MLDLCIGGYEIRFRFVTDLVLVVIVYVVVVVFSFMYLSMASVYNKFVS
jgi:hypothetical protein